jgi:hypothetical protein
MCQVARHGRGSFALNITHLSILIIWEDTKMRTKEDLIKEYIESAKKAEIENPSSFKLGWISALGYVLGDDCPKVI